MHSPRELCYGVGTLRFGEHTWERAFEYAKGGRQGGCDTPELWARFLDVAIVKSKKIWKEQWLGLCLDAFGSCGDASPFFLDIMCWPDDLLLVGNSIESGQKTWVVLSSCIHDI